MENLFTQIANSDPFTSGAWILFWSSAVGVFVASWILIRKFSNFFLKATFMSLVMFFCFAVAKVELESGMVLWVPAIPFFGVDFAFEGKKYFDQLIPYLVASASVSALICFAIGGIGRAILGKRTSSEPDETQDDEKKASKNNA
ncbi:hypothetical protein [Litoribrevibacter albus]|uniref:Uncharacterized protein n=1 Tax=Litoribrevibacter albus TaxID=1473156 RepID=A0AA37S808_9GAMM|nr:hypothetical protein [Litoribrevibacter albus]GLQ30035.1 hypothetical protein GCM10007876_05130 [Litoribrevibacter albus]